MLPREKLELNGAACLTDDELLAILLGSGGKNRSVFQIAKNLVSQIDANYADLSIGNLLEVSGIGKAKASIILSALEFSRRRIRPEGVKIRSANDIAPLLNHLQDRKQEHFVCISLNGAHEVIETRTITIGLLNNCQVHPREVFAEAIVQRAAALILAHNHPSGSLEPSIQDKEVTQRLFECGTLLGIRVLDHVIVGKRGAFFSFAEQGLRPF